LKSIAAPTLPDMPAMKVYDMVSSLNIKKERDIIQGSKTFKAVIIPKTSGRAVIPAVSFSYFNTQTGRYAAVYSLPIELNVLAADNQPTQQVSFSQGTSGAEVTSIGEDIHYINEGGGVSAFSSLTALFAKAGLWNLAGLAMLLLSFVFAKFNAALNSDTALSRKRKAYAAAKARVKEAEELFSKNKMGSAMTVLSDALSDYLSDKLSTPTGGLTLKKITELSRCSYPGIKDETVASLEDVWQELDMLRFAPSAQAAAQQGTQPISVKTLELIEALEKDMSK